MSEILIVHELEAKLLNKTVEALSHISLKQNIVTINLEDFLNSSENYFNTNTEILFLHFDLNNEISSHQLASKHARRLKLKEINPYNELSEIFDNKFLFYNFMLANGFKQAKSIKIDRTSNITQSINIIQNFAQKHNITKLLCKTVHGTESRDQLKLDINKSQELKQYLNNVHKYDDLLVQELIPITNEKKILCYESNLYCEQKLRTEEIKLINNFNSAVNFYTQKNNISTIKIYSLDLINAKQDKLILLEANIRPAGIYKQISCID
ncbi:MAG: hypothetical protein MK033_08070 [Candidatus Caenarcaniphilales bacterium]|nr:hypothetical protein [Candidatus Caenarcaniphilales bacterium]